MTHTIYPQPGDPHPGSGFAVESSLPPPPPPPPAPPSRFRRTLGLVAQLVFVVGGIALSFQLDRGIFVALIALFVLVVPFEKMYPRQKGQKIRRPLVTTDMSFALMNPVLGIAGVAAAIIIGGLSFFWLPGLALRPLVAQIPAAALPFVAFLLFDFVAYWTHRWAHEVPFMWRFHAVHHSPEHMDWISGFRAHPFDGVLIAPGFFFLLGAGIDAELAGIFAVFQIILGIFFHANVRVRWRVLDRVAANPEFHHWHHANEADSIGHNYGAALPWWDLAFGTFFMPKHKSGRRPQNYGVDEFMPRNLVGQLSYPCRGARKHLKLWRHPIIAVKTAARGVRTLVRDMVRSARRPTRSVRRETVPGSFSTNGSLFDGDGPGAVPQDPVAAGV